MKRARAYKALYVTVLWITHWHIGWLWRRGPRALRKP